MSTESIPVNGESVYFGGVTKISAPDGLRAIQDNPDTESDKRPFISCAPENMDVPLNMIINFPDRQTSSASGGLPYINVGWETDLSRAAAIALIQRIGTDMKQPYYHAWPTDFISPDAELLGLMDGESTDLGDVLTDISTHIGVNDADTVERVQWVERDEAWRTTMISLVTKRAIHDSFITELIKETVADDKRKVILAALPAMREFYHQYVEIDP